MPNNSYSYKQKYGLFHFVEISPTFSCTNIAEFSKNANSAYVGTVSVLYKNCLATVGVCVFRASASAGALFYFTEFLCLFT